MSESAIVGARHLLALARGLELGVDERERIEALERRIDEPLRVAVAGRVKAGKSTLVNALVGEQVAPTDAGECTRLITWYHDGPTYRVDAVGYDGIRRPVPFDRSAAGLALDLGDGAEHGIKALEVTWPSPRLRDLTLIDTPGLDSVTPSATARTEELLVGDGSDGADVVVYLLGHVHPRDARFLEAFRGSRTGGPDPSRALAVLSRADEIGAGRPDAMISARSIADRRRADRRLRGLVQDVVPVAGLLAEGAATLRQQDHEVLRSVARLTADDAGGLMRTVDRFTAPDVDGAGPAAARVEVLDRLGLFGCRATVAALRSGDVTSADELASWLLGASGVADLRAELDRRFTSRRDVVKARAVHAWLEQMLPGRGAEADGVRYELERARTANHELTELHLLELVWRDEVALDETSRRAAIRVLGGDGPDLVSRLGLPDGASTTDIDDRLIADVAWWRRRAEHPLARPAEVELARAAARSLEGAIATRAEPR